MTGKTVTLSLSCQPQTGEQMQRIKLSIAQLEREISYTLFTLIVVIAGLALASIIIRTMIFLWLWLHSVVVAIAQSIGG